ncbi:MAG: molybdopterin-dependent oxidoreductase [Vicinamibacterales bacterium]
MAPAQSRRELLRQLAWAGIGLSGIRAMGWSLPVLAQGETLVPFTDIPATFNPTPTASNRLLDLRTLDGAFTPADRFFTTQHYGHPEVDPAAFRLRVTGMVASRLSLSVDDLQKIGTRDLVAGFECSGNSPRSIEGLVSNGRWTGVPLRAVLEKAGVARDARELVFFGADRGQEQVEFRTQKYEVEQQFGRSLTRDQAFSPEPLLAWALNGAPLTKHQGSPLRLIVPGWYGVANVKWLAQIHAQDEQYLGKFQARWYRTLKEETIDGETKWKETAITKMRLKSVIARVTTDGRTCRIHGFALSDGTPIRRVEVQVDDGPWQPAQIDPATNSAYSWKLFSFAWNDATPGEHTLVSRAVDASGRIQPTLQELAQKKTFLEDNSQFPRKVRIA